MSPRRVRREPPPEPRPPGGGSQRAESWPDGDWMVRQVSGYAATKPYRCPGCDHEIPAGRAHIVAWPADVPGVEGRRHWHPSCWRKRMDRGPGGRRRR